MKSAKSNRAFTLIELLVVVAIIALMIAILLPSLAKARTQARRVLCASNEHQIGIALMTYRMDQKEFPPQALIGVGPNGGGNATGAWPKYVHSAIGKYIGRTSDVRPNEVFYCPAVREDERGTDRDREQPANTLGNPYAYLHITFAYWGRLDMGGNDPALLRAFDRDMNGDGVRDSKDVPTIRKLYVKSEPDSRRVLLSDWTGYWYGNKQWRINHEPDYRVVSATGIMKPRAFSGENTVYGDGHAEWRTSYRVSERLKRGDTYINLSRTATFIQGNQDIYWW